MKNVSYFVLVDITVNLFIYTLKTPLYNQKGVIRVLYCSFIFIAKLTCFGKKEIYSNFYSFLLALAKIKQNKKTYKMYGLK
ncbi:hypothetical protein CSC81_02810 [Tenacibaculum discolor]|uniref:Uncharacterized protein n=1 Tax=Tenacibaculum discolor TaxID=361581 RepID=A0A2G1BX30_9FLAO|nr:hypothetical protein CSC81_02810 [Tenacibaculum discolor]